MNPTLDKLQNDPKTARTGTKWTDDEENKILEYLQADMDYEQIALKLQRSVNSVKSRIMETYIKKVIKQEMILEEVSTLLHIPIDLLTIAKRRYENKQVPASQRKPKVKLTELPKSPVKKQPVSDLKCIPILEEIRDYLKILADK